MTLEDLNAIEAIRRLKAIYCYVLDYKDWDAYVGLFTRDGTLNADQSVSTRGRAPNPQPEWKGRDMIKTNLIELLRDADTVHQVHSPIIDLTSSQTATGIWAMEDIVKMPGFFLKGRGHYRETYRIEDGQWRIASLHLTRTYLDILEGTEAGPVQGA